MTPRRRRQPRDGATRVESTFPTKGEVATERGRRRHAMAVGALVPPGATRVAIRIATRVATVYTNAPKRRREPIFADLCTLLRPHRLSATAPQPNSVSECPKTARRGPILPFVYTIAIPRPPQPKPTAQQCTQTPQNGAERPFWPICVHSCVPAPVRNGTAAQQCTQTPRNGAERPDPPICVHYCDPKAPTTQAHSPTVYTNAPKRRGEAISADLCTLLRPHNRTRDRVGPLVPRRRRPHGPRDARALGPEAHAARAVTQPPTHTNSRSLL